MIVTMRRMRKSAATQGLLPCMRLMLWLEDRDDGALEGPPLDFAEGWLLRGVREVLGLDDDEG